ncbi:MAG: RDD family protein [Nitrospirota bacterium]|jgi:uncharacterized RDD family membrane protein YckC
MVTLFDTAGRGSVRYAGLCRRLTAWTLDVLLFFGLFGLVSGTAGWKIFVETDYPDELVLPLLVVCLLYFFVDQLYLPVRFGTTTTRWMTGYRVQKTEGGNPGWLRALARVGGIYVLESLTLGIVTFVTSLFRKDRAALHDLASRTRAVLPEHSWRRGPRLAAIVATFVLSTLVMANFITYGLYNVFVSPTKKALVSRGIASRPAVTPNPAPPAGSFGYHGIEFLLPGEITTHVCEGEFDTYNKPRRGLIEVALFRKSYKYFLPIHASDKEDRWLATAAAVLRAYPLKRPAHEIAAGVAHNEQIDFPLLSPVDNALRLYGSLIYAVIAPLSINKGVYTSIQGEETFGLYFVGMRGRAAAIWFYVVREGHLEDYSIVMRGTPEDVKPAFETVLGSIRIIEEGRDRTPLLPPCSGISSTGPRRETDS